MDLTGLEQQIGYTFKNRTLLAEACRHSSYVNEQPGAGLRDNERLEFLGDAVLNLVVSHLLMNAHPDIPEGDLSRMRATLVNENRLSRLARTLTLGSYLQLGKGEAQTGGRRKKSILADAFEALVAAIYMDGGYEAAFRFLHHGFSDLVSTIHTDNFDYKSKLQELVQVHQQAVPVYTVVDERGPDHDKTFTVRIAVQGLEAEGIGKSKKMAEQDAARQALALLEIT